MKGIIQTTSIFYWSKSNWIPFILLFLLPVLKVSAQDTLVSGAREKWRFQVTPYLMFPYANGEVGIGQDLVIPVDAKPSDILKKTKMAAMLTAEANINKWTITSDLLYMNLSQKATPTLVLNSGTVNLKVLELEVSGLYFVAPFLEVGAGIRYNYLQTSLNALINTIPSGTDEISGRHHKSWYDPIIITRYSTTVKDKWTVLVRGDAGGFGVGSKFTWQLQAYAGYRFSKLFHLSGGYRIISTNYSSGSERKNFLLDASLFGPVIRFGFNF